MTSEGKTPEAASLWRKRPVVIAAMQWDGSRQSIVKCCRWVNRDADEPILSYLFKDGKDVFDVQIWTLEGPHIVSPGDWIIRGVQGEFYPCKPEIFAATYEPALDNGDSEASPPASDPAGGAASEVDP